MIKFDSKYFNIEDTLYCGQIFRFKKYKSGYILRALDKACYLYYDNDKTVVECDKANESFFEHYFDFDCDYNEISNKLIALNNDFLTKAVNSARGLRLLNQSPYETTVSFIISQQNRIPRIKQCIELLSEKAGKPNSYFDDNGYAFPTREQLLSKDEEFYCGLGLGYRSKYLAETVKMLDDNFFIETLALPSNELYKKLILLKGIGDKVASCVMLFGYSRRESFPVDTWVEKLYLEDFKGEKMPRQKITKYFENTFKELSGYAQQYMFYYKRGK